MTAAGAAATPGGPRPPPPELDLSPISVAAASRPFGTEVEGMEDPKDPADRVLVATALVHGLTLATADRAIHEFDALAVVG